MAGKAKTVHSLLDDMFEIRTVWIVAAIAFSLGKWRMRHLGFFFLRFGMAGKT